MIVFSVKELLLEIDFIKEYRTTWGNKEVPQTFYAIPFIRKKKYFFRLTL